MMNRRRFLLSSGAMLALAACDEGDTTASGTRKSVALVLKTLDNPFFVEMAKAGPRAERTWPIAVKVAAPAKETSVDQQIELVETLLKQRVDAIVIAPADSVKLIPVLKQARDRGVAVVNIDNRLDHRIARDLGLVGVPYVGVDNVAGAYLAAKALAAQAPGPAKAAVIEGIRNAANAQARKIGALRAFSERSDITLVGSVSAEWLRDEAFNAMEKLLAEHSDLRLVFAANDVMALGALDHLDRVGNRDVLVAGYDALPEAVERLGRGLVATIDQQAEEQGYQGIAAAWTLLNGGRVEAESLVALRLLTMPDR
jgi:ribose transport system substrate-binding protein